MADFLTLGEKCKFYLVVLKTLRYVLVIFLSGTQNV